MEVEFEKSSFDQLETDPKFTGGFAAGIVSIYRKRMQQFRSAVDERDLYSMRSFRLEKLKGARSHQHSIRLNDQWRLIIELQGKAQEKTILVVGIEDYH
jgi:proteic killer suppression protein